MSGHRTRNARTTGAALTALALLVLLPTTAVAAPPCDDLLTSHRPDGTSGDGLAVSITSQSLERGADGWATVGWDVAADTDLRTILVVSADGLTELPPTATSADGPVQELHFCGTRSGSAADTTTDVAAGAPPALVTTAGGQRGGPPSAGTPTLGLLGATIGAGIGGVVLLLSRGSRHEHEVA